MEQITFRFQKIKSEIFGFIHRPYADVQFLSKNNKWRKITLVVDTGADYTLLPRREALFLGIDLSSDCEIHSTRGIGGSENVYLYPNLKIKLGNFEKEVPVGFLDRNDVPALLGRHQFMELLKVVLQDRRVTFEF